MNEVEETGSGDTNAPETSLDPVLAALQEKLGDVVVSTHCFRGDRTLVIDRGAVLELCQFLRDEEDYSFDLLSDITAVDYLGRQPRFEVVYHLYSIEKNHRLRLKVPLEEGDAKIPSVVPVWPGANWLEREAWDLYGIEFEGHPDLRRIYLYEEFEGHPLRKDYPKHKRQPLVGPGARAVETTSSEDDG